MKKPIIFVLLALFLMSATTVPTFAQAAPSEIKTLQDLYNKRDYAEGYRLGKQFTGKSPGDERLQYWYAANGARSPENKATLADIEKFAAAKGENLWALMALAVAQMTLKPADALATAEKIVKLAPDSEETVFVYNSALFQNKKYEASLDWLNQNDGKIKDRARFLDAKAVSLYFVEKNKKDAGQVQQAFDVFAQALKSAPLSVNANFLYGNYLVREKRFEEASPFLRQASALSPNVVSLRDGYWSAIKSQTKKTDEQKNAELEAAIDAYLKQAKNSPDALLAAWKEYLNLTGWDSTAKPNQKQKRLQLKETIIAKYPNTKYDEEIAFIETTRLAGKYFAKDDGSKYLEINNKPKAKRTAEETKFFEDYDARDKLYRADRIAAERAFLKRSPRFEQERFGQASFSLFQALNDKKDSQDAEVSALVKDAVENYKSYWGNVNSEIASMLLARQDILPDSLIAKDAERYARAGVAAAEAKIKLLKDVAPAQIQEELPGSQIILAQVLIKNDKLDEAEQLLTAAAKTLENADLQNFRVENAKSDMDAAWADFYAAKKDWERAETAYVRIYRDNEYGRKVFQKLYEKKSGGKDGFDEYYAGIQQRMKIRAKERMAESRIRNPQDVVAFSLKNLDDKVISFNDLKGKIVVINVWGTWCGPCVAEMNELQEFFDKYKDDKDVAVLTIDSNDELADVKKFVADRKLRIPVLIDDGYIFKLPQFSKNAAYPTTLFIDKDGKVAFVKTGNSGNLVEEFSWRVDILKEK